MTQEKVEPEPWEHSECAKHGPANPKKGEFWTCPHKVRFQFLPSFMSSTLRWVPRA